MTDSSGTVVWEGIYKPFGDADVNENSTVENNFRFAGQYYDAETGLHYNYHRYYDPKTGRYLTPDPIGLAGGINPYVYASNDPINVIDPFGLDPIERMLKWKDNGADERFDLYAWESLALHLALLEYYDDVNVDELSDCELDQHYLIAKKHYDEVHAGYGIFLIARIGVRPGKVSTGRTQPRNLKEKLAMEEVKANPKGYTPERMPEMSDSKNNLYARDGWVKRVQNVNGVEIHYVENVATGQVRDFKFVN